MQVWAGGAAGGTDFSDEIATGDASAVFEFFGDAGKVSVVGFVAAGVADCDEVSVGAFPAGVGDDAVGDCLYGSAGRGAVIDALVIAVTAEYGVDASAKSAGDAGDGEGTSQELALEVVAAGVEVSSVAFVVFVVVEKGVVGACGTDVFGGKQAAVAEEFAVEVGFFEGEGELVADACFGVEVDGVLENFHETKGHHALFAGGFECLPEGVVDGSADGFGA